MWYTLLLSCGGTAKLGSSHGAETGHSDRDETPTPPGITPTGGTLPVFLGDRPKNVLMISVDTFRRDHLDRYGDLGLTPFIDSVMNESLVLDDHVQCSNWTFPGTTCVQLGRLHTDTGFLPSLRLAYQAPMPNMPTLASWLTDAGFYTVAISTNGWYSPQWNSTQGFSVVEVFTTNAEAEIKHGADIIDNAIAEGKADNWFLHVHLIEPHPAYNPPESYLGGLETLDPIPWDLSDFDTHYDASNSWPLLSAEEQELLLAHLTVRYQGEIRYFDDQLSRAWADLDARGLLDDTLVVLWNDHGEAFWEHGHQTHAWTLHSQENGAWAAFWAKNIGAAGWPGPTHGIDIAPTVLAALGRPMPPEITGIPVGLADPARDRHIFTWARLGLESAIIRSGWKLHFDWVGARELYDLTADPDELNDLYSPTDPVMMALWPALEAEVIRMMPFTQGVEPVWPSDAP